MDDDLIVVDDVEAPQPRAGPSKATSGPNAQPAGSRPSLRLRSSTIQSHVAPEPVERATRSSTTKPKLAPKLKLKLSDKATATQSPGTSFLGQYDRELDSDDEDLLFEEQFILRLPPGEDCDHLRKMVAAREVSNDVWLKFKDSRRAMFHIGNSTYSAKLVDLPCIIESQKTLDNKQMFKVADICQMLVVGDKLQSEEELTSTRSFNIDEFIWPHGITPPLHHARKRRFRKRVNKRTIESVEQEVERLLDEDAMAAEVKYEVLENVNPDLSDSELIEREGPLDAPTPAVSDLGEAPTPRYEEGYEDEGDEEEEELEEGDIDEELAAELEGALGGDDDDEDEDDEDEDESEDESEDEDDEEGQSRKLINEEIRDLEAAVAKKGKEIASSANPLIRKRFEDALKKLTADLEMKLAQRDEMKEKQRMQKEAAYEDAVGGGTTLGQAEGPVDNDDESDEGDLFGGDD